MADTIFPAFLKLVHQTDNSAKASFLREVDSLAASAEQRFKAFGNEAARQLDQALSVGRNSSGALNIGADRLKAEAAALQARAVAARELATATELAARAEGDLSEQARLAITATRAQAVEEERAAKAALAHAQAAEQVQAALNRQASATDFVANASRRNAAANDNAVQAQRAAFAQLGQQMQDVVVQTQMGTSAVTIFTQQVPQMAFALSGLTDSANRFYRGLGNVGQFLAGPWGAAVFTATAVLGPFVASLFKAHEAAEAAKAGANNLADAQSVLGGVFDLTSGKIKTQNDLLVLNARLSALNLQKEALTRRDRARATFTAAQTRSTADQIFGGVSGSAAARAGVVSRQSAGQGNTAELRKLLQGVFAGTISGDEALKRSANLDFTGTGTTREEFQQAIIDRAWSKDAEQIANLINQSLDRGELAPGLRREGRQPRARRSSTRSEAERLAAFGDKAAESIKRINEQFNEQPRLIDQAAQATRELDKIIADLSERKPAGFEKLISEARDAKQVIEDALTAPMRDMQETAERRAQIEELISMGYDAQASALQSIWALEDKLGSEEDLRAKVQTLITEGRREEAAILQSILDKYPQMKAEIVAISEAEEARARALEKAMEIQNAYLDATRSVRREVESILSGTGSLSNLKNVFRDLQGRVLTEQLFGDMFRDLDKYVKEQTGIGSSVDLLKSETERAGTAASAFADALNLATSKVTGQSNPLEQQFDTAFAGRTGAANDNPAAEGDIVVTGRPDNRTLMGLNPQTYFSMMSTRLVGPLIEGLNQIFSTTFFNKLQGVLGGALGGYMTGGATGGILGAIKGIEGLPAGLSKALGKAMNGASTGTMIAGLGNMLGIKMSNTGAQIGGAIGSMIPIPGGSIIGSIIGGIAGKLFSSAKKASATITGGATGPGVSSFYSNNANQGAAATGMADNVIGALNKIADTLGGSATGSFAVSVGIRDKNYRVDTNGTRQTKGYGVVDFGADGEAAIAFAIADAIKDGAIIGLRATTLNILKTAKDIEVGLQKAVDFENVFRRLKSYTDPVGAALDELDREFTKLKKTFTEAGASAAEFADLQKLYEIERQRAVEQAMEQVAGSLKSLLDQLTVGNDAYSLRDREAMAMARYQPLAARVRAGDTTAYDAFAEAAQALLDIQRQMYGSQAEYFASVTNVRTLTETALSQQTAIANSSAGRDSPFSGSATAQVADNAAVVSAIEGQTSALLSSLGAVNDNLGILIAQGKITSPLQLRSAAQGYF